jgi:hypothetical protein
MKLLEEKYGTLEYDPTVPCITASFTGFMNSDQFKSFLNKGLEHLIDKKKIHGKILWLADTTKHVVQPEKDTTWVAEDWNPRALRAGIRHVAFILPENAFGGVAVKNYAAKNEKVEENKMVVEMFNHVDSAKEWFRNLK